MGSPSLISSINSCYGIIWYGFHHLSLPSTVVLCIIRYGYSFIGLIHQQLFHTSPGVFSLFCLIHRSFLSSINYCFVHRLERVFHYWSHPSTVVSYIIWHGFLILSCPSAVVFFTISPSGMDSPSLVLSISSCFVHHLAWTPSSLPYINISFVHHLLWTR